MEQPNRNRWLIQAITLTSTVAVLISIALFFISNSINKKSDEHIRGGIESSKLESLHRDFVIALDVRTLVTENPELENLVLTMLWNQFLKIREMATGIDSMDELNNVKDVDDWMTNFSTSSIKVINEHYRNLFSEIKRLIFWQNILFIFLVITQILNMLFVAKLAWLDYGSKVLTDNGWVKTEVERRSQKPLQ